MQSERREKKLETEKGTRGGEEMKFITYWFILAFFTGIGYVIELIFRGATYHSMTCLILACFFCLMIQLEMMDSRLKRLQSKLKGGATNGTRK